MKNKKAIGFVLLAVGIILLAVSLLADVLGIGGERSLWVQADSGSRCRCGRGDCRPSPVAQEVGRPLLSF